MLKRSDFHLYQHAAHSFAMLKKKCALFLDMGLGKTTTSLTVASDLLDELFVKKVLIVAPLRVANTVWKQEKDKWDHLNHLRISICTGSMKDRVEAIRSKHDILVINRENIKWLVENFGSNWKWDMIIVDESSSFKSHSSSRFKALKLVLKYFKSVIILSGTPSPEGLMDLYSQIYIVDSGERLGKNITKYRRNFFRSCGYQGYSYEALPGSEEKIKELIKDICITMKSEDYLDLPELIDIYEYIELPDNIMKTYKEFEKEFILELGDTHIETPSAANLAMKLLQFCNGFMYDEDGKDHIIHDLKIKALKEIVEDNPSENFLIAYNFKADLKALKKAFPQLVVLSKEGGELKDWNKGKIKMLACHPKSAGHGLNAQYGGSTLVWYGLNWSLELYQQFVKRLHRQGQTKPVRNIHLVVKKGIDHRLIKAIHSKAETQEELIKYLKYSFK